MSATHNRLPMPQYVSSSGVSLMEDGIEPFKAENDQPNENSICDYYDGSIYNRVYFVNSIPRSLLSSPP